MTSAADSSSPDSLDKRDDTVAVSAARLFRNWEAALRRAKRYVTALGFDAATAESIARRAVLDAATDEHEPAPSAYADVLVHVRKAVQKLRPSFQGTGFEGDGFPEWRVNAAIAQFSDAAKPYSAFQVGAGTLSTPPLARRSMRPNHLRGRSLTQRNASGAASGTTPENADVPEGRKQRWERVALRRRFLLGMLVAIPSLIAARFMLDVLPHQGGNWLEVTIAVFFGALFGWISIGFWTALAGFVILVRGGDRFAITRRPGPEPRDPSTRTAIIMPICEEPVDRIFAGLEATYHSLEQTGRASEFDIFVLSDTADPDRWADEEAAWFDWSRSAGLGRIYYRHRRVRIARKSGNVADFCRRWGSQYRYMIVLDADSVMAGPTLTRLVDMMEATPTAALIQTVPVTVRRQTLFGRVQQFAGRAYGPMFSAGLHYWQLGDGQYWGHNAIIRIAPFMEHCSLPILPGKPPLGGEILSHDFVEAALLGRAGWDLWLAYDLGGTYEESSTSLLEEMKRDRRWCQGNLQHLRLLMTRGLAGAHRALFLNGIMSYVSALLWFCFLLLSSAEAVWEAVREPNYFPAEYSLFPEWPVWRPDWAIALAIVTAAILFLPKVLSILLIVLRGNAAGYGGVLRLCATAVLEILFSTILAPIRMVFHTRFVLTNLFGATVTWRSSSREDSETSWREALRHHGLDTLVASAWGIAVFWLSPMYFWWLTPIVAGLVLSVPVSVLASRVSLGNRARARGLFLIPEETKPPAELVELEEDLAARPLPPPDKRGVARMIVDPFANAVHRVLLRRTRRVTPAIAQRRRELVEQALLQGTAALSAKDQRELLYDPSRVTELHRATWALDGEAAERWHPNEAG